MKALKIKRIGKKGYKIIIASLFLAVFILLVLALSTRIRVYEEENYYSKKEVALYIYKYKKIPKNYITKDYLYNRLKKTAEQIVSEGYNIGGDNFEYAESITAYTNSTYLHECDIYIDRTKVVGDIRGTNRLVYNQYGKAEVFYTEDHYKTFKYLSPFSLNIVSNIMWICCGVFAFAGLFFVIVMPVEYKENFFKKEKKKNLEVEAEEVK